MLREKYRLKTLHLAIIALSMSTVLSGCATYQTLPLSEKASLLNDVETLSLQYKNYSKENSTHKLDPTDGLDLNEAAILAVFANPDLRAKRAVLKVAEVQVFAAGLLPDPQLGIGFDKPTGNTLGLVNAWSLGLGYDIIPLITRTARVDAARQTQSKVHLELLWQEWQVIQQARTLAVRMQLEEQRLTLLQNMLNLYQDRYHRSTQALQDGNITLDVNGTDLTALVDTLSQINQLEQTHNQTRHSFNLLLGLEPQATITIVPLSQGVSLDPEIVKSQLNKLPDIRPDLLALKAGYESQEARVRAEILAQFPSLGVGVNRTRDTGNVKAIGLSINLSLPIFSGNRGNIEIERATREQLREEYKARLAQTTVDVYQLLELQTILQRQLDSLQTYLPTLKVLVDRARVAYDRGDIQALTFLNMESTWINKRLEQISLVQSTWENHIALEALLALPGFSANTNSLPSETKEITP